MRDERRCVASEHLLREHMSELPCNFLDLDDGRWRRLRPRAAHGRARAQIVEPNAAVGVAEHAWIDLAAGLHLFLELIETKPELRGDGLRHCGHIGAGTPRDGQPGARAHRSNGRKRRSLVPFVGSAARAAVTPSEAIEQSISRQ